MAASWTARDPAAVGTSSTNRRILLISLVLGLLAALLLWRLLSSTQAKTVQVNTVPVVVAKQDIPARTTITADMLDVKQVPQGIRLGTAFTDTKAAVGQVTRVQVNAGEQVLSDRLAASARDLDFAAQVPAGMRAASITVAEVVDNGGLLQPGDEVDVVGVFEIQGGPADTSTAFAKDQGDKPKHFAAVTVLTDVKVLAVAQHSDDGVTTKSNNKAQPDAKSVTLAVTPDDAQKLFLADQMGTLRLSLHKLGEHDAPQLNPVPNTLPAINGGGNSQAQPAPTAPGGATQ